MWLIRMLFRIVVKGIYYGLLVVFFFIGVENNGGFYSEGYFRVDLMK